MSRPMSRSGILRTSNVTVKTKVLKITAGYFNENGEGVLDKDKLMAIYDEEEGFTVVGRPSGENM